MFMVHPVFSGILAGLVHTVMGPEHLSTIITFSAFQGKQAFWLGIRWGIGHMGGMASIAGIFLVLKSGTGFEKYEHCMDYAIGVFLAGFGFYFLYNGHLHFDAEWNPKVNGCACQCHTEEPDEASALIDETGVCNVNVQTTEEDICQESCSLCLNEPNTHHNSIHSQHRLCNTMMWRLGRRRKKVDSGSTMPSALSWGSLPSDYLRRWGACVSGFVQGLACPAGLVGIAFIKSFRPVDTIVFTALFFVTSTVSMGLLAMTYGLLTQRVSSKSLARGIYYSSACLSLFLGIAWIYLNVVGSLDQLFGHEQLRSNSDPSSALAAGSHTSHLPWRAWLSLLL